MGERSVQHVPGLDDHAPTGPDGAGGHEGTVLCEGELFGGTREVGDTSDNQTPLFATHQFMSIHRNVYLFARLRARVTGTVEHTFITGALHKTS